MKLIVSHLPLETVIIPFHPTNKSLGKRSIRIRDTFYIPGDDVKSLKVGDIFRLKDLCNVQIEEMNDEIQGISAGLNLIDTSKKIQWTTTDAIPLTINKPELLFKNGTFNSESMQTIEGYIEPTIRTFNSGEIIQFERFGFVRIEKQNNDINAFFVHR
jgi:glutamyl-tRNA synthetase